MVKTTLETRQAGASKKPDEPDNNNKGEGEDLIEANSFNIRLFEDFQIDLLKATTSQKRLKNDLPGGTMFVKLQ